jgi:NAD(P)-dependent dehydrogenase (short-subunit alcohol dehydrogenase family)
MVVVTPARPCVLVTGASSGIGRAIAVGLSSTHRVILSGRDKPRLEAARAECTDPGEQVVWEFDLEQVAQISDSLGHLLVQHGLTVQIFIHCAGALSILPVRSTDSLLMRRLVDLTLISAAEITRLLISRKANQQELESVLFLSSIASKFGARGFSGYAAAKAALDGYMRSIAVELAPRVRANSILIGAIRTPMTQSIYADPTLAEKLDASYPLGAGRPEDVLHLAAFLVSDKARWITGQEFVLDGGRTANISQ